MRNSEVAGVIGPDSKKAPFLGPLQSLDFVEELSFCHRGDPGAGDLGIFLAQLNAKEAEPFQHCRLAGASGTTERV